MALYGLVDTFIVDKKMKAETLRVSCSTYNRLLRNSTLYILAWMQRTALISDFDNTVKHKFIEGKRKLDRILHKQLINYYFTMKERYVPIEIQNAGRYSIDQTVSNNVYAEITNNKILLLLEVSNNNKNIYVPLIYIKELY